MNIKQQYSSNIFHRIQHREYGIRNNYRNNQLIIRHLICKTDNGFKKFWELPSKMPIAYERGHVFSNQMRQCYSVQTNNIPRLKFEHPSTGRFEKVEDFIISECSVDGHHPMQDRKSLRPSMLAVTANNHLRRVDLENGAILQDIHLTDSFKFRTIQWDTEEETFVVSSTHTIPGRNASSQPRALMALAVFKVWPLSYVGMLAITTDVFGSYTTDAMISNNCLIVMYYRDNVKIFSFEHILAAGRSNVCRKNLFTHLDQVPPNGLQVDIFLKCCPPVLFEVKSSNFSLSMGGIPWHYIVSANRSSNQFNIHSVETKKLALGGELDFGKIHMEPDKCYFHPDESGKIVHMGSDVVRVLKLQTEYSGTSCSNRLDLLYVIAPNKTDEKRARTDVSYTSSGRAVKHRIDPNVLDDDFYDAVQCITYEEELDILVVTSVKMQVDSSNCVADVHFYDNQTGRLLSEMRLKEPWDMDIEHTVMLDQDTLIHLAHCTLKGNRLYVYRLDRTVGDENVPKIAKKRKNL